jgi:hypothetical protein
MEEFLLRFSCGFIMYSQVLHLLPLRCLCRCLWPCDCLGWVLCSIGVVHATDVVTVITVVDCNNSRSKCSCNTNKEPAVETVQKQIYSRNCGKRVLRQFFLERKRRRSYLEPDESAGFLGLIWIFQP